MRKNLLQKKSRQAFTLIELSFILIVISVLVAGMVSIMSSRIANEKARQGNENFATIYEALGKYLVANKALPCPASLIQSKISSADYGSAISASNCVAPGVYQSNSNTNLVYGMVPSKTLGLSSEFAEDSYGSKIIYVVDKRLTTTSSDSFETNIQNSTAISISGGVSINNAVFVLISRGANKSGAYQANSSAIPSASSNADELKNDAKNTIENTAPTPSTSSFEGIFVQSSTVSGFDDSIFYKTAEQLLNDFDAWSLIPCTSASSSELLYGTSVTWPKAYAGQVIAANTACPTPNWNGSITYPTKKCGAKGVWGSVINSCTCSSGYTGNSCIASNCTFSGVTGIADGTSVSVGSSSIPCDSGYSGTIYYTCSGGNSPTIDSGSCTLQSVCSGGDISDINVSGTNYKLHVFNSSGTFSCPSSRNIEILVVGGGGSGGNGYGQNGGGGGGSGGVVHSASFAISTSNYTVTVGNGGAAQTVDSSAGNSGQDSSFSTLVAKGGGGGGYRNAASGTGYATSGGSGGGAPCNGTGASSTQTAQTGETSHYGNAGGNGSSTCYITGGGGGAGSVGSNGSSTTGGNGGSAMSSNITGSTAYYGAGGGGSAGFGGYRGTYPGPGGTGGSGIGGNGDGTTNSNATAGTPHTGSGGGGSCNTGGAGGSGVVIIRYIP